MERGTSQVTSVLNLQPVQALEKWLKTTNTKLTQVNGQRRYGGPPEVWDGPIPGDHCEIFISQIPRDTYEDVLLPLFSSVGPLWEFRLMMNFSGQNRGFAYAKYGSAAVAFKAVHKMNGYMLESGAFLRVRHSTEKKHLSIEELPATTRQEDLLQVLRVMAEGVDRLSLKTGPDIKGVSAVVAFFSHHAACMAKKILVTEFKTKFGLTIIVNWHTPMGVIQEEPEIPQEPLKCLFPPKCHGTKSLWPPIQCPLSDSVTTTRPDFCRAVGGPTAPKHPFCFSASFQAHVSPRASPVFELGELCKATRVGQPLYKIQYGYTGNDGFTYFNYNLSIPGVATPFQGFVSVKPGPSNILEVAKHAAAQQVLQRVSDRQHAV